MHLAKVIGSIVATQKTDGLMGIRLVLLQPYDVTGRPAGKTLAAVDLVSAAPGQMAFYVKGREAAMAMRETFNPVDAALVGLVDTVEGRDIGVLDYRFRRDPRAEDGAASGPSTAGTAQSAPAPLPSAPRATGGSGPRRRGKRG